MKYNAGIVRDQTKLQNGLKRILELRKEFYSNKDNIINEFNIDDNYNSEVPRLFNPTVIIKWKHLLWFIKGDKPQLPLNNDSIDDLIESKRPDKSLNQFTQSSVEAEYIISKLTLEDMQILDPFLGGGTTAIAMANLNRRFIGIDISVEAIESVSANIRKKYDLKL
jgi:DNA modification methylase